MAHSEQFCRYPGSVYTSHNKNPPHFKDTAISMTAKTRGIHAERENEKSHFARHSSSYRTFHHKKNSKGSPKLVLRNTAILG